MLSDLGRGPGFQACGSTMAPAGLHAGQQSMLWRCKRTHPAFVLFDFQLQQAFRRAASAHNLNVLQIPAHLGLGKHLSHGLLQEAIGCGIRVCRGPEAETVICRIARQGRARSQRRPLHPLDGLRMRGVGRGAQHTQLAAPVPPWLCRGRGRFPGGLAAARVAGQLADHSGLMELRRDRPLALRVLVPPTTGIHILGRSQCDTNANRPSGPERRRS